MKDKLWEIWEELKSVLSGRTFDALLPPLAFVGINMAFGLEWAAFSALALAGMIGIRRIILKQSWYYALAGLIVVGLAAGLAWLTQNASNYFIPGLVSSAVFLIVILISLIIDRPFVAWISHITRKWPLDWFWRNDVKPAYREATWIWAFLFTLRFLLQIRLFIQGEVIALAWANALLGWPVTLLVLIISYVYGIWRLHRLGGPGAHEFLEGREPPWEGQKRGF